MVSATNLFFRHPPPKTGDIFVPSSSIHPFMINRTKNINLILFHFFLGPINDSSWPAGCQLQLHKRLLMTSRINAIELLVTYGFTVELITNCPSGSILPIGNQLLQQRLLNKWSSFCSFCERWDLQILGPAPPATHFEQMKQFLFFLWALRLTESDP